MTGQITAEQFTDAMRERGVRSVAGVPCGHLAGPWALFERAGDLTPAACEGAALSIAAGWELGGRTSAVLCQNSGFGNLLNPLASLLLPYRIPVLVIMTMRGWPEPGKAVGLPPAALPGDEERLTRPQVVASLMAELSDEFLVTTTGYLSRQAHHEQDRPGTFYMQGSMGHAAAIGLGLATSHPDRRTVILDGDGAFLMHLGTGSTIGASGARNLVHIVVDNGCYESTGCQATTAGHLQWPGLGHGLGYGTVLTCDRTPQLAATLRTALASDGPVLVALTVEPTPGEVHPRASASLGPADIAGRFRVHCR